MRIIEKQLADLVDFSKRQISVAVGIKLRKHSLALLLLLRCLSSCRKERWVLKFCQGKRSWYGLAAQHSSASLTVRLAKLMHIAIAGTVRIHTRMHALRTRAYKSNGLRSLQPN